MGMIAGSKEVRDTSLVDKKEQIRVLVSNVYDLQQLRIAAGNRLVQSFYIQMGIQPSETPKKLENSEEQEDKEKTKVINKLKKEYKCITDAVVSENKSIKRVIKELHDGKEAKLKYVSSETDYKLVDAYMLLAKSEEAQVAVLDKYVKAHPLWDAFFKDIKGCGTLMSAMCIAYLDIYKARYVSSFYKFCGVDTVQDTDSDGNPLFRACAFSNKPKCRKKVEYRDKEYDEVYEGKVKATDDYDEDGNRIYLGEDDEKLIMHYVTREYRLIGECSNGKGYLYTSDADDKVVMPKKAGVGVDSEEAEEVKEVEDFEVYELIDTGEEYVGEVVVSEHGRRKGDIEMREYVDKDGEVKLKKSITYNPVLKAKLCGVLTGCILKAQDPVYAQIYYDYRSRLDNSATQKDFTAGHKNRMALRYMVKQFLRNLWVTWRNLEGLEVNYPYEVAKLGNTPHKYNEYQCQEAAKWDDYRKERAEREWKD